MLGRPFARPIDGVAAWTQGAGHHGVVDADVENVVRIPWNDVAAFVRVLAENPGQIAGFIATPYHHPSLADNELPDQGYWESIRELCDRHGVVLIVDDVRCGFRLSLCGSHAANLNDFMMRVQSLLTG